MNTKLYALLCLTLLACAPGQFEAASAEEIALQNAELALSVTRRIDPDGVDTTGLPVPKTDPRVDPDRPAPGSSDLSLPEMDPRLDPDQPSGTELDELPELEARPVADPSEPAPADDGDIEDLGDDLISDRQCQTVQRCRRIASGQTCTDFPQQCPIVSGDSSTCSTVVRRCTTTYTEVCSPIEICTGTR